MSDAVILAEVYQCCTALNGKQRPRPVLYYNMALIKTRLVCLWLVLSHSQFLLRDKTVYAVLGSSVHLPGRHVTLSSVHLYLL